MVSINDTLLSELKRLKSLILYCPLCLSQRLKLLQLNGDDREHLQPQTVHLSDTLKTEELCSAARQVEQGCACHWEANLIRNTSRRALNLCVLS
ncbi:hypothetical protein ACLKA7_011593 [Drosophila subpalustris]